MSEENKEEVFEDSELGKEITGAVDEAVKEIEEQAEEAKPEAKKAEKKEPEQPETEEKAEEEESEEEEKPPKDEVPADDAEDTPLPDEAQLARAVKAGVPLEKAIEIEDAGKLEKMIRVAEAANGKSDDGESGGSEETDDPLAGIPELDPEEFDEDLVKVTNGLRDVIKKQHEELKSFRARQEKSVEQDSIEKNTQAFDNIVSGMDEYRDVLGEGTVNTVSKEFFAARAKLAHRVEVLGNGYASVGEEKSLDELIKEAAALEFGSGKNASSRKERAERRSEQFINRSSKSNLKKGSELTDDDIAAEIDAMFNK